MADAYNSDSQWHQRIVGHDTVAPDSLLANPLNFRIHSKLQQDAIAGLLSEVGWVKSVVVNQATGHIVDGHARVTLALRNNSPVPVEYVELSEAEERLVLASLDNIVGMAGTDKAQLDALLHDVATSDEALMGMLSEMAQDAGLYFGNEPPEEGDAEPQIDRAEELREKWGVETGQLWRMPSRTEGQEHRIICGDCTDADVVERVMGGERAEIILTDPPYNIGYKYDVYSDSLPAAAWGARVGRWRDVFLQMKAPMIVTPGNQNLFLWGQDGAPKVAAWIKNNAHGGASIAHFAKFEPILFFGKHLRRRDSDVFVHHVDNGFLNDDSAVGHSCPKPIRLWDDLLKNYTDESWVVYEPFSGSGTTIIAAENLQRQCRAVEISPAYVAVALQRYQDAFGITPELVTD